MHRRPRAAAPARRRSRTCSSLMHPRPRRLQGEPAWRRAGHLQPWAHAPTQALFPSVPQNAGDSGRPSGACLLDMPPDSGQPCPECPAGGGQKRWTSGGPVGHAGRGQGRLGAVPGPAGRQAPGWPSAALPALTLHCPRPGPVRRTRGAIALTESKVADGGRRELA